MNYNIFIILVDNLMNQIWKISHLAINLIIEILKLFKSVVHLMIGKKSIRLIIIQLLENGYIFYKYKKENIFINILLMEVGKLIQKNLG
jgi:hypothetical protein